MTTYQNASNEVLHTWGNLNEDEIKAQELYQSRESELIDAGNYYALRALRNGDDGPYLASVSS